MSSPNLETHDGLCTQENDANHDEVSGNILATRRGPKQTEENSEPYRDVQSVPDSAESGAKKEDDGTQLKSPTLLKTNNSASIKYRVVYRDQKDKGLLVESGPYLETPPPAFQDESSEEEDEESDTDLEGGAVFDITMYMGVTRLGIAKRFKPGTNRGSQSRANSESEKSGNGSESESESEVGSIKYSGGSANVLTTVDGQYQFKVRSHQETEMVIRSVALNDALRSVVKYDWRVIDTRGFITLPEPYYALLHHREDIARLTQKSIETVESNNEAVKFQKDFQVMQTFLDARWAKKIEQELIRYRQQPPLATFEMLWMLFRPGTRVISNEEIFFRVLPAEEKDKSPRPPPHRWFKKKGGFLVHSVNLERKNNSFVLHLSRFVFDGKSIYAALATRDISYFTGERDITSLDTYPVGIKVGSKTVELNQELELKLEERGRRFWEFSRTMSQRGSVEVDYDGPVGQNGVYNGRAIMDPRSYYQSPGTEVSPPPPPPPPYASFHPGIQLIENPSRDCFFSLPSIIGSFLLKTRTFDVLEVDFAHPCSIDETAIENLQIPRSRLDLIRALTEKYEDKQKSWSADFIQSKGEGQIFLLHGPSGVGKTYTTECISKFTGRPLLALTVADIGTDESKMEESLAKWFKYSEAWEAIMLIDEADVYFERRGGGQLQRNSLVSAFLRSMEYYRGILFLTTNRLGHIDDAILSRIHLVIEYQDLSDEDRTKIWSQFFRKLEKDRPNYRVDEYLESFVENDSKIRELKLNGREIRNAFQTAVALAEYAAKTSVPPKERVVVSKKHLEGVAEMSGAFKKYMRDWKGDEDRRAYLDGSRMDQGMKVRREQLEMAREAARKSRVVGEKS